MLRLNGKATARDSKAAPFASIVRDAGHLVFVQIVDIEKVPCSHIVRIDISSRTLPKRLDSVPVMGRCTRPS